MAIRQKDKGCSGSILEQESQIGPIEGFTRQVIGIRRRIGEGVSGRLASRSSS